MNDISSSLPVESVNSGETPEDVSFDGEWEVVEDAMRDYDRRHNWFVSIRSRRGHMQPA